ncbi:MAG TPA: DUF5667 domain-containing protein [Candidatus Saccharimonadales bacterium]|nr:DUF5667 domain-containing protein [Candidatus Saccharimonadales bacterium]
MFDIKKVRNNVVNRMRRHPKPHTTQQKQTFLARSKGWVRRWRWYLLAGLVVLLGVWWMGVADAAAPGDLGYPIKRAYERIITFFTYGNHATTDVQANYAAERVNEALRLADRMSAQPEKQQAATTQTMQRLLEDYLKSYGTGTTGVSQDINRDAKFDNQDLNNDLQRDVRIYIALMQLRLEAPPAAQATVLQSLSLLQTNIATIQDALHTAPVTPGDSEELSRLVSQGFLTRTELTQLLAGATSNRQFLDSLRNLIRAGQLPSSITYAINYDLVKQRAPQQVARFEASVAFDEMNKVAVFAETVAPTPDQKQAIQSYLANYKVGDVLPREPATRAFVMPLVYGLNLTPDLANTLNNVDAGKLSPVRKALYDTWKPLATTAATKDPKQLYGQALQLAGAAATRSVTLMEQVQLEVLNAVRANIAYLALPPGWTATQVAAVQDDFAQQIKDLKAVKVVEAKAQTAMQTVADITIPLVAPVSEPKVEVVRQTVETSIVQVQQQLIAAASTATDPAAVVPDIDAKVTAVQKQFDAQVTALGKTSGITASEIAALRQDLQEALSNAKEARSKLQEYVTANADAQTAFSQAVATVQTEQTKTATTLQERIARLDAGTQASLATSLDAIRATIAENVGNLGEQLSSVRTASAGTEASFQQSFVTYSNQIALLESKLNLSDTARAALKQETDQAVSQLKTEQSALITDLQKRIDSDSSLHAQANDATKKTISDIKSDQAALLSSLQDQADSKQVLKDQLEASIAALRTVQVATDGKVDALAGSAGTLAQQLASIQADLNGAVQTIKTNATDTAAARGQLQTAINNLTAAQAVTGREVSSGLEDMATQLRQVVSQVTATQTQTTLDLTGLTGTVDGVKASVSSIQATQASLHLQLEAQAQANLELRQQLGASVGQLQQAQTATQAQVDGLKTDLGTLKSSVTAIASVQAGATTSINQLLDEAVNWRALPGTLAFSQTQFQQYEQQLSTEFAAKAAALQQQFEDYKRQLDTTISQLRTDTSAQLKQLKDEQAALKAQLQQAQQQLQQLQGVTTGAGTSTGASTGTSTPSIPSL